jgi:hypothetical protein
MPNRKINAAKKKLTDERLAEEFTAMAVRHLDKLPRAEREEKIREFSKRLAKGRGDSRRARGTSSETPYTAPSQVHARGRQ